MLCVVDVFSRKSFVVPIKHKSDTTKAMKTILVDQKSILIQSDNGTEFVNLSFQALPRNYGINFITAEVGNHNRQAIVERFNRTLESMINRYQESRNTNKYINVLDDLVYHYNNTFHRSINDIPEHRFINNPSSGVIHTSFAGSTFTWVTM